MRPFQIVAPGKQNSIFLAAFGNKYTDAMAYEKAGVDLLDIFIINKKSEIMCLEHCPDSHHDAFDTNTVNSTFSRDTQKVTNGAINPFNIFKYGSKWKRSISSPTQTSQPVPRSTKRRSVSGITIKTSHYTKDMYKSYEDTDLYNDTLYKIQNKFINNSGVDAELSIGLDDVNINACSNHSHNIISYSSLEGTEILKTHLSSSDNDFNDAVTK